MQQEQLIASFVLDREHGIEIALPAEQVVEAVTVKNSIRPLPGGIDFLEGVMQLRQEVIPIINLKKRLTLRETAYASDAKVAVIAFGSKRYGLLFDDIRDVLRVPGHAFAPLDRMLMAEDAMVSDLITLEQGNRTLELLDLAHLFANCSEEAMAQIGREEVVTSVPRTYSRYVIFSCRNQVYGIPVDDAREICFFSDIDRMFKSGVVEGALQLRGRTIPVLCSASLLGCDQGGYVPDEHTRILVMETDELSFGLIVDAVHQILIVPDDEILAIPGHVVPYLSGLCQDREKRDIMLLDVAELIDTQMEKIKAMARVRGKGEEEGQAAVTTARHVITENCYLVFSIGKHFAIELKDVQEIIDAGDFLRVSQSDTLLQGIINLRGRVVPVLGLRQFYSCPKRPDEGIGGKLIIGRANGNCVALHVDEIVTIYKQEQFHLTPSLRAELQARKDTLDRLIEFINDNGIKEHVLVVNVASILRNHLGIPDAEGDGRGETQASGSVAE